MTWLPLKYISNATSLNYSPILFIMIFIMFCLIYFIMVFIMFGLMIHLFWILFGIGTFI